MAIPASEFEVELARLINRYSQENGSNTPDFLLASFLVAVLASFNTSVQQRETWYGRDARSSGGSGPSPVAPRSLPSHWHLPTVTCAGYRRGDDIDVCADCGGPRSEHAGYSQAEIDFLGHDALAASRLLTDAGFVCGCPNGANSRVDLHQRNCPFRVFLMISGIISPSPLRACGGSSFFTG